MLFAFGRHPGAFYASDGLQSSWSEPLPQGLSAHLKQNPLLKCLAIGEGGAYWWKELPNLSTSGHSCASDDTTSFYPSIKQLYDDKQFILSVTFGYEGAYFARAISGSIASDPQMIRKEYTNGVEQIIRARWASFGVRGAWVVVDEDGLCRSHGLRSNVLAALYRRPVRRVELDPLAANSFFIEFTDGTMEWKLSHPINENVLHTIRMIVQTDHPRHKENILTGFRSELRSRFGENIVFAFGPQAELYTISRKGFTAWRNCSRALGSLLERSGSPSVVTMGEGGAYLWKAGNEVSVSPVTEYVYPEVWRLWRSGQPIEFAALGSQGRYVVVMGDGSVHAFRESELIRTNPSNGKSVGIRSASFGYGGSFVIVESDGTTRSFGLASNVREAMLHNNVKSLQLSQVSPTQYYCEYMDGSTSWELPRSWHQAVVKVEGLSRRRHPAGEQQSLTTLHLSNSITTPQSSSDLSSLSLSLISDPILDRRRSAPPPGRPDQISSRPSKLSSVIIQPPIASTASARCDFMFTWIKFRAVPSLGGEGARYRQRRLNADAGGFFSDVFMCDAEFPDRSAGVVAVKRLRSVLMGDGDKEDRLVKRVMREVRFWEALDHPNVAQLMGYSLDPADLCIISRWYSGGNVRQHLNRYPDADRLKLVCDFANGLAYLHDKKIIHGDMKPDNIMIDDHGCALIIDFGLSNVLDELHDTVMSGMSSVRSGGNPRWQAPEVQVDETCRWTRSGDVYAFACVALEVMTGREPWAGMDNRKIVIECSKKRRPVEDRRLYPVLAGGSLVWDLLELCWEVVPEKRPWMRVVVELLAELRLVSGSRSKGDGEL